MLQEILNNKQVPADRLISKSQFEQLRDAEIFAIWGTGKAAMYALNCCKEVLSKEPVCIVDNMVHQECEVFDGIPLLNAKTFFTLYPGCLVLIACSYGYQIDRQVSAKGCPYITFDTNLLDAFVNKESLLDQIEEEQVEIEKIYGLLADQTSQKTFINILNYRIGLNKKHLQELELLPNYFGNDVVPYYNSNLHGGGAIVDCGAYIGDTVRAFFNTPGCKCDSYYALEPEKTAFEQLCKLITEEFSNHSVNPLKIGAWSHKDTLHFCITGAASHISDYGKEEIEVDSLDAMFAQHKIGFIKMDIEGAEVQAINGACKIIQRDQPIMAVSAYHKSKDLWKIPSLLYQINPSYRLYIRHHSIWGDDTVCYALPSIMDEKKAGTYGYLTKA